MNKIHPMVWIQCGPKNFSAKFNHKNCTSVPLTLRPGRWVGMVLHKIGSNPFTYYILTKSIQQIGNNVVQKTLTQKLDKNSLSLWPWPCGQVGGVGGCGGGEVLRKYLDQYLSSYYTWIKSIWWIGNIVVLNSLTKNLNIKKKKKKSKTVSLMLRLCSWVGMILRRILD